MCLLWFFVFAGLVASPVVAVESRAQTTLKSVMPRFETPPLFDDEAGGNAMVTTQPSGYILNTQP
jgi:hypothetical protein